MSLPMSVIGRCLTPALLVTLSLLTPSAIAHPQRGGVTKATSRTVASKQVMTLLAAEEKARIARLAQIYRVAKKSFMTPFSVTLTTESPLNNDEQRFPISAQAYGPLVTVNGSVYLRDYENLSDFHDDTVLVAFVKVTPDEEGGETVPLVAPYTTLKLNWGINCVFLTHAGSNPATGWDGFVVKASTAYVCDKISSAEKLQAAFDRPDPPFQNQDDYDGVARFGEDTQSHPVIGFRCLNAWCEIGPDRSKMKRPVPHPHPVPLRRESHIKAWHDEQVLSTGTAKAPTPTNIRATVTPVAQANRIRREFDAGYVKVATVWLDRSPSATVYGDPLKWGMMQGENEIWLRRFPNNTWKGYVKPMASPANVTFVSVNRHDHARTRVPGTARFRWHTPTGMVMSTAILGQGVWVPCDQGCCEVDAFW